MLPCELKLTSLGHCYVHLPETFVSKKPAIKGGAIVSLKSLQTEHEIFVMWNGQLTSGEHVQLDYTFGQANQFQDELVIISLVDEPSSAECSFCRVELIKPADYQILSQHSEASLLDTCRLISRGLVLPVFVSQHVHVLVRVVGFEPAQPFGLLTKWTEMNFEHNLEDNANSKANSMPKKEGKTGESTHDQGQPINKPVAFLSYSLGLLDTTHKRLPFYSGSMLICGERGSGKTHLLQSILAEYKEVAQYEYLNCKQFRGKRPESIKKRFGELLQQASQENKESADANAIGQLGYIIALDDIDSFLSSDPKHEEEQGQEILYKKRLVDLFCHLLKQLERRSQVATHGHGKKGVNGLALTAHRSIVLIATCKSLEALDARLAKPQGRRYFNEMITIQTPSASDRFHIMKSILSEQKVPSSVDDDQLKTIAQKCASFMPTDLRILIERALINACSRTSLEFSPEPMTLQLDDFQKSLDNYVPINLRAISLQPKSRRTFAEVGGMFKIKEALTKAVLLPLKYPNLYKKCPFKSQNSILLFGPPGCGKTLLAEALANQEGLNSICVRGPELLSKYIGASEAAVRDLFKRAHLARPCVIFFDEFESLVARRGADSTGVTDRVVNQFLTILDGVESLASDVFILAASSRPDMIDPAMLRPGRLDRHLYCPLPDHEDRREILKVLSRSVEFTKQPLDVVSWSAKLEGFTGADIQAFLYSAQLKALHDLVDVVPARGLSSSQQQQLQRAGSRAGSRLDVGPPGPALAPTDSGMTRVNGPSTSRPAQLQIKVSHRHLTEAFNEMKRDVDSRLADLLTRYPSSINQLKQQRVAVRATLA